MSGDKGAILPLRFDTAILPPDARFDAWQRALVNFDLARDETEPFAADAQVWLLDPLILTDARVAPLRYERDRMRLATDATDHLAMVYLRAGGFVGDYGDGVRASVPGSLTVLDLRRACWTDAEQLEAYILSVPRSFVMSTLGGIDPHGLIAEGGAAALLGRMLDGIVATLPSLSQRHAPLLAGMIRDVIAQALRDADRSDGVRRPRDDALVTRVRTHIDQHIADDLDAAAICAALGVSRSALYRAFEGSGGVQQQIQRRRLQRMRAALADPADGRSVSEIAVALGFADKSHASRLFKRVFGCTPGHFRETYAAERLSPLATIDAPELFERWTNLLD